MAELFATTLFLQFATAMVAMINPLYGIPNFLGMTRGNSQAERRASIVAITVFVAATIATTVPCPPINSISAHRPARQVAGSKYPGPDSDRSKCAPK